MNPRLDPRTTPPSTPFWTTRRTTSVEVTTHYADGSSATVLTSFNIRGRNHSSHSCFAERREPGRTLLLSESGRYWADIFSSLPTDVICSAISMVTWKTVCSLLWTRLSGRGINKRKAH